jgi:hypothetical protein
VGGFETPFLYRLIILPLLEKILTTQTKIATFLRTLSEFIDVVFPTAYFIKWQDIRLQREGDLDRFGQ